MRPTGRFYPVTLLAGLLFLGLMVGTYVSAADKNPCSEDMAKFCKDVKPDFRSIMECLEEHENELSEACKAHETKMGGRRMEIREEIRERVRFRKACNDDIVKFCKDATPATGGILKCLTDHEKEISTSCRESVKKLKGEKKKTE